MSKTAQTLDWTATESTYREYADKIHNIKSEIKELQRDIKKIKYDATKAGCNPRVLMALIKVDEMHQNEKDALTDALEM